MIQVGTDIFPMEFYDEIEKAAWLTEEEDGTVYTKAGETPEVVDEKRRSKVKHVQDPLIKNTLMHYVMHLNAAHYGFDLYPTCYLQYTTYDSSYKGHYDWHQDDAILDPTTSAKAIRKLSITMPLSWSHEYEGGDLEIDGVELPDQARQKGSVVVFPSFFHHRVTPVTSGQRRSLVAWFVGPLWR